MAGTSIKLPYFEEEEVITVRIFMVILQQINVLDIIHRNLLQQFINTNPWKTKSNLCPIKLSLYRPRQAVRVPGG